MIDPIQLTQSSHDQFLGVLGFVRQDNPQMQVYPLLEHITTYEIVVAYGCMHYVFSTYIRICQIWKGDR